MISLVLLKYYFWVLFFNTLVTFKAANIHMGLCMTGSHKLSISDHINCIRVKSGSEVKKNTARLSGSGRAWFSTTLSQVRMEIYRMSHTALLYDPTAAIKWLYQSHTSAFSLFIPLPLHLPNLHLGSLVNQSFK